LIPLKSICQTININLSQPQATEVYKGLIQGNNLKNTVIDLQKSITELEKAVVLDLSIQNDLKKEIEKLNKIISDKADFIKNQEKQNDIEQAKIKDKLNKRFGFGLVGGYGLSTGTNNFQGFIGVGVSYNLFRF
jgi:hypothetical protein